MTAPVRHRDVFICFSKARPGEAKVAIALKDELEQRGLFAFEYEDWSWVASAIADEEPDVDRATLRKMLTTTSVVVLISPHKGQASTGVQTEIEELRSCGSPVILLHWSPEGWHPLLDSPELKGLNLVWHYEGTTSGVRDVAQNVCDHIARQLAMASLLACQVHWLQGEHPLTGARLLSLIPVGPYEHQLLNFRLERPAKALMESGKPEDLDALSTRVAAEADLSDLSAFVQDWRAGADLLAEQNAREAKFQLARPVRTFYTACELLCKRSSHRNPELERLPGHVLRRRGLVLTRLNRTNEALLVLQRALAEVPDDHRYEVYQALALAQQDRDCDAAILSLTHAVECAPETEIQCGLTYDRGVLRSKAARDRVSAIEDFTSVLNQSANATLRHSALRARACLRTENHDYKGAIADYTMLLADADATPRTAVSAWMDRGALYRKEGRLAEAIADWTHAIEAADSNQYQRFRTLEARAQAFEETGQPLAAATDYEAMISYSAISRSFREELLRTIARLRG